MYGRLSGSTYGFYGDTLNALKTGFVPKANLNNNTINLSSATTFNVADLRLAFQIQKFLERNARAGARYTEFLRSHFGVSPRDERLQRPEYIGGSKAPVIISEVLQTGSSDEIASVIRISWHAAVCIEAGTTGYPIRYTWLQTLKSRGYLAEDRNFCKLPCQRC